MPFVGNVFGSTLFTSFLLCDIEGETLLGVVLAGKVGLGWKKTRFRSASLAAVLSFQTRSAAPGEPGSVDRVWKLRTCRRNFGVGSLKVFFHPSPTFPTLATFLYEFRFSICSLFYFTTVFYLKSSVVESVCLFELFLLTPVGSIYRGFWCRYGLVLPLGGFLRGASRCLRSRRWCGSRLVPGRRTAARMLFRTGDIFYR